MGNLWRVICPGPDSAARAETKAFSPELSHIVSQRPSASIRANFKRVVEPDSLLEDSRLSGMQANLLNPNASLFTTKSKGPK